MPRREKGQSYVLDWMRAQLAYQGDDCLAWPYSRNWNGYGFVWSTTLKRLEYAHRVMCRMAHGEPPTPKHMAAHTCNNGHLGCVNPKHLAWKTNRENMADRVEAGTLTKRRWSNRGSVPAEHMAQIIALRGKKNQREIAKMFGISPQHVSTIQLGRLKSLQAGVSSHEGDDR